MQFEGQSVEVIRRPYQRTLRLQMKPHEPLRVTTAMGISDSEIVRFLESRAEWIRQNLATFAQQPAPPAREGLPGEVWMYQGRPVTLSDAITVQRKPFVVWGEERAQIFWPEHLWLLRDQRRAQALEWIEESRKLSAENLFRERVELHGSRMGLKPQRVRVMKARTRWGSCSSRGSLNLNWKLIGAPEFVVDAIVVHELAHLRHMNHSRDFWNLVAEFAPDHEAAEAWLRQHQHLL